MEKEIATHSRVLAWRIPGTGEPGELPYMGSHRVGHDWSDLAAAAAAATYERLFETPKSILRVLLRLLADFLRALKDGSPKPPPSQQLYLLVSPLTLETGVLFSLFSGTLFAFGGFFSVILLFKGKRRAEVLSGVLSSRRPTWRKYKC